MDDLNGQNIRAGLKQSRRMRDEEFLRRQSIDIGAVGIGCRVPGEWSGNTGPSHFGAVEVCHERIVILHLQLKRHNVLRVGNREGETYQCR